ncbi:MAG: hypothetical protein C4336_10060 [Armatimonadota bacterium]
MRIRLSGSCAVIVGVRQIFRITIRSIVRISLRAICEHYLAGWNTYERGRILKTSRQAVCKALRLVLSKVKAAWEASPYYGME